MNNKSSSTESGKIIQIAKHAGVGIDCHAHFIQISVIVRVGHDYMEFQKDFPTDPTSIDDANEWVINTIRTKSCPSILIDKDHLSYAIESTSTYHLPIVKRWGGLPEIVNPKLAGPSHRKTDKLDATMLARQNIDGLWSPSYLPSSEIWALRSLIDQREAFSHSATKRSNSINSLLLKFGITLGHSGSVTKNLEIRQKVMDLISDNPSPMMKELYPDDIPCEVKDTILKMYEQYDEDRKQEQLYLNLSIAKAMSLTWETSTGSLAGTDMIRLLTTVPGVGERTAILWLSIIITPRRFINAKAASAYCGLDPSLKISAQHVTSIKKRGGNKALHSALCFAASGLMGRRSEPFGIWGYKLYQSTGKWKKGTNAVARRMAISLYYVQSKAEPFDYNKFTIMEMPKVVDMSISELVTINPEFHRYIPGLNQANIFSTQALADRYHNGSLVHIQGLKGKKFIYLIKDFIQNQSRYKKLHQDYQLQRNAIMNSEAVKLWSISDLIAEYPDFHRYGKALSNAGITTVNQLICCYYDGTLSDYPRLGAIFEAQVEKFITSQIH